MDIHTTWLVAAIKGSVNNGEVSEEKLLSNLSNCYGNIKKNLQKNTQKYIEFEKMSTEMFLLCCPEVSESDDVALNKDKVPLLRNLQPMNTELCFKILTNFGQLRHLKDALVQFSTKTNFALLFSILEWNLHDSQSHKVVSIILEVIVTCCEDLFLHITKLVDALCKWKTLVECDWCNVNCELETQKFGEYMITVFEFILTLFKCYEKNLILEKSHYHQTASLVTDSKNADNVRLLSILEEFLEVLENALKLITSMVWIDLHSFKYMDVTHCQSNVTMQTRISHLAFYLNNHLQQSDKLQQKFKTLPTILQHLAVDPKLNVDENLTTEEIINKLQAEGMSDSLINILACRPNIFSHSDATVFLENRELPLSIESVETLLINIIDHLSCENVEADSKWKSVGLTVAENAPASVLEKLISKFNNNKVLRSENLDDEITVVINQFANSESEEMDYRKYLFLCLQSSSEVIKRTVEDTINMVGSSKLASKALKSVNFICLLPTNGGVSLLINILVNRYNSGLTKDQEFCFMNLINDLIEVGIDQDYSYKETKSGHSHTSFASELIDHLVLPFLESEKGFPVKMINGVNIIKILCEWKLRDIMNIGLSLRYVVVSLCLIYHNTCVQIELPAIKLRLTIQKALDIIFEEMKLHESQYEEDITAIEEVLKQYELHPYCLSILKDVVPPTEVPQTYVDSILRGLITGTNLKTLKQLSKDRSNWIFGLTAVLPQCNENEWLVAMQVTHFDGNSNEMVPRVLDIFRQVLWVIQDQGMSSPEVFQQSFKCFSQAAINFFESHSSTLKTEQKIDCVMFLSAWWCCAIHKWDCDSTLLTSLLLKFIQLLKDYMAELINNSITNSYVLSPNQMEFLQRTFLPNFNHCVPESPLKLTVANDISKLMCV